MKPSLTRPELAAVAILFAIGVSMRAAAPSWMAVEHFDEGVYASNLYSPLTGNRYPDQHLYAPPLLPFLLEWAAIFGGPHAVMWVNVVAGSLTLLVVWGMVRSWWGPPAAIAALTLLASNEFHIAYSRAALTDALLCLWLTAGVWAGWRAVMMGGTFNVLAAGGLAGLAWWTKYNGWLTLAITGAGTAGWVLWGRLASGRREPADGLNPEKRSETPVGRGSPDPAPNATNVGRGSPDPAPFTTEGLPFTDAPSSVHLLRWAATALVAFLVWSPWLWQLQSYGGYTAVAKNHAGYFAGLSEWIPNAYRQLAVQWHYAQFHTWVGLTSSMFLPMVVWKDLRPTMPASGEDLCRRHYGLSRLSNFLMIAWLGGLAVAVPMYRAYPRLAVPLLLPIIFVWSRLYGSHFVERTPRQADLSETPSESPKRGLRRTAFFAIFSWAILPPMWSVLPGNPTWQDRTSLQTVASEAITRLKSERLDRPFEGYRCAIYVLAEPGLFFHLSAAQPESPIDHLTQAASDYGMAQPGGHRAPLPAYLLTGPHADAKESDRLVSEGRLTLLAEFAYHPSDLVLLDEYPVWELKSLPQPVTQPVRLFHVKTD